jgi:hypothetical protein
MESLRSSDDLDNVRVMRSEAPPAPESPAAEPAWSLGRRILFRFTCVYFFLFIFPFPLDLIPLQVITTLFRPYQHLWDVIIGWAGKHLFHADTSVHPNGSGDTTYNYVQLFCFLMIALAAAAVWTLLDRKRASYARLDEWLRLYVRYSLATAMLSYGGYKVIVSQFPGPTLDRLVQPFGDASPMGLLWTFMGASAAYTVFAGLSEMIGGLLLTFRRTELLGALVSFAVLCNIVMLNFAYDVPVKIYSSHLLVMAVFVAAPDLRRLIDFFVLNRRTEPAKLQPLFERRWLHRGALVFRTLFVLAYVGYALYQSEFNRKTYGDLAPRSPLRGIWNVEEITVNGQVRPAVFTDAARWRRVVFDHPQNVGIQLMDDSRKRYVLALHPGSKTMIFTKRDDPKASFRFTYQQPEPGILTMQGTLEGETIQARLRKTDTKSYLLLNRGFHWINEFPFNR